MDEPSASALRLRELMRRLVRAIGLLERGDAACCGITLSQCHALGELAAREGLTPSELAARLGIDPSAVTRIADALERNGLARREGDPSDRRVVRLVLTPEGHHFWSRVQEAMLERSRALLQRLPPERRPLVLAALADLVDALEKERCLGSREGGRCRGGDTAGSAGPL